MMKKVFEYHRHLMLMDARKDIILQNDFTNRKIKNKSAPFFSKYTDKIKQNRMRIYYLLGFCAFFSLGPVYDFIVESRAYDLMTDKIDEVSQKLTSPGTVPKNIQFSERENKKQLAQYYMELDRANPTVEITPTLLSTRISEFRDYPSSELDIQCFVTFCALKQLSRSDMPSVNSL